MTQTLEPHLSPLPSAQPSSTLTWWARLLSWFCWLAMGVVGVTAALAFVGVLPTNNLEEGTSTLINFNARLADPAAQAAAMTGLGQDWLFRLGQLFPLALFLWALFSARQCFTAVSRGAYYSRAAAVGLRNLGVAVLLYNTVSPVVTTIPKVLYVRRIKGDQMAELDFNIAFSQPIALMLVFAGTVTLISAVMAHAALVENENRSFV